MAVNILHIQKVAGIAGSENHLLTLLPQQRRAGFEPSMLVLADSTDDSEEFVARMRAAGVPTDVLRFRSDISPSLLVRLVAHLRAQSFDIIHTHLFHADLYAGLAARLVGHRHIVSTKHGYNPWRIKWQYAFLDRVAASFQQQIICISHAIRQWLIQNEHLPAHKMQVIHYALDRDQFLQSPGAAEMCEHFPPPVIGTVTRLMHQKGVHVLLQAFAKCLERYPKASLVIAGDGPARPELERQAAALGMKESVYFLGYVTHPRLCSVVKAFDVFAFPTFGEGFGLVLLEAMALAKPVVASNVMAIPEIVVDGETGLLVPPDNAPALANALVKLLSDAALSQKLGLAGQQRAQREFTVDRMIHRTSEVYLAVLGRIAQSSISSADSTVGGA